MQVNGAHLVPDPDGGLFWPAEAMLVVADLHFEKGSAFAGRGVPLPPYDTRATLAALAGLVERHAPERIVCLGDSFHDAHGPARLGAEEIDTLRGLAAGRDWIWIVGNHDPVLPNWLPGRVDAVLESGPLRFRHEPTAGGRAGEVAGHLHPKAAVRVRGQRLVRRCFASDGLRAILPALGAFTGGLDVLDAAFAPLFPGAFQAVLLGRGAVHAVPSHRLVRIAPAVSATARTGDAAQP